MYKTLSAPLVVQVEISEKCPNRCLHCYNFWRRNDKKTKLVNMSLEKIDRVIDQLISHHVFHIVLTGGEPLLNKKVLFRALEKFSENGLTSGINSSLFKLTITDAERLKELKVSVVLTSLIGPTAEIHDSIAQRQDAFKETIDGIRLLQKVGVPVDVNMVISQKNKNLVRETGLLVKSLGVNHFNSTRAGCPGNCPDFSEFSLSSNDFQSYLNDLYNFGQDEGMKVGILESYPLCAIKEANRYRDFVGRRCLAGVTGATVAVDGNVRPCSHLDISYGNLFDEELNVIWEQMKDWRNGSLLPPICQSCKALPLCGGGCRMEAKMRNGSITAFDPYASPEDVPYVVSQLMTQERKKLLELPNSFCLNPKARWRKEKDLSVIVFIGPRFACYLNKRGGELVENLSTSKPYAISDLNGWFKEEEVARKFLTKLFNQKILMYSASSGG